MFGSFLPSLWSSSNQSLLGSRSRHCYAIKWADFYKAALKNLQPGITEFVIHLGFADEEMKAATRERDTWGAAWRQRDFDFFTSPEFRQLLAAQNIKLVTWREIASAAKK